jgi:lysozyme
VLKGIDVSHHNGVIDWERVKAADIDFAMLRACWGWDNDNQIDRQLQNNIRGCEAAGLPYGLYHYSYAKNPEEAKKEAAFFLRVIRDAKPLYPIAFDFEEKTQLALPLETQLSIIEAFLEVVEAAGYYGILYMSASSMEQLRRVSPQRMDKFDRWVAHVGVSKPAVSGNYGLWQYSWKGRVDGIQGDVDLDYAYKDYPALIRAAGLNGWGQASTFSPPEMVPKTQYDALIAGMSELAEDLKALAGRLHALAQK